MREEFSRTWIIYSNISNCIIIESPLTPLAKFCSQRVRPAAQSAAALQHRVADTVDVIRLDKEGKRELVPMRWGLVPARWQKSLKEVPATFNARAESVADRPMFRTAFKERRRIRMDRRERCETAASFYRGRRLAFARVRRPVGSLERSRHRRMDAVLHDHRVGCQGLDGALSRPHAGAARGERF